MCEAAEKIQKEWQPKIGDVTTKGILTELHFLGKPWKLIFTKQECTWLPRQGQLQKMVEFGPDSIGRHGLAVKHWRFEGFIYSLQRELWDSSLFKKGINTPFDLYPSYEQLWLVFVMYEKYQKIWDNEKGGWSTPATYERRI
jgi:hypothetical protein